MKHKLFLNGKEVTEEEFHKDGPVGGEGLPMLTQTYTTANPLISESLGCMPSQVDEMRETLNERGIKGVEVMNNGALAISSRNGRREVMAMKGQHDNDGCFGDG